MKKLLLFVFVLGFTLSLNAQRALKSPQVFNHKVTVDVQKRIHDLGQNMEPADYELSDPKLAVTDALVGNTEYDLQTNSAISNRIYRYEDGTMAVVYTRGYGDSPDFPGRGTGYNSYDGTAWGPIPSERIEDERCGWPNYAQLGADGEIVVSHTGSYLKISTRDTRFTGDWNYANYFGPVGFEDLTWPRMTTTNNGGTIHLVAALPNTANGGAVYQGLDGAILYSRSNDGGATWVDENIILDGMTSADYTGLNADDYIWVSKGDVAALIVNSQWHDLFMMKTEDNGATWEKTVIWEHPYPMFDWETTITTDTIWAPDGSSAGVIDDQGKVHMAFGLTLVMHEELGTTYQYFPGIDGIVYWNEDMPPFENANQHEALSWDNLEEDVTYVGWIPDINGNGELEIDFENGLMSYRSIGAATMPTLAMDENGIIYLAYSTSHEDYMSGGLHLHHIFGRANINGSWTDIFDITGDVTHTFDECIYPLMANMQPGDEQVYLFYQKDFTPGLALDDDHGYVNNDEIVATIDKEDFGVFEGIGDVSDGKNFTVSQNYPNPVVDETSVKVALDSKANVSLDILNLVGQVVYHVDKGTLGAGLHVINIDASQLETGVYFYNVNVNDETASKKMIVK
jgi:hypothetical protein